MKIEVGKLTSNWLIGQGAPWFVYDPRQPVGDLFRFFPTWAEAIAYADKIARLP